MNHTKFTLFSLFVLASATNAFAAPCIPETLSYYQTNYGELNACSSGVLNYFSFDFAKLSSFGAVTPSDIYITPDPANNTLLFNGIQMSTFNHAVLPGQAEQYLISYVIDPPPIVAGDDLPPAPSTSPAGPAPNSPSPSFLPPVPSPASARPTTPPAHFNALTAPIPISYK